MVNKKNTVGITGTGDRLRIFRKTLQISAPEMAEKLSLYPAAYNKNERGVTTPGKKTLTKLVEDYGISMNWLFFNHGPRYLHEIEEAQKALEEKKTSLQMKVPSPVTDEKLQKIRTWENLSPDIEDLLDHMANDPRLRYEVLINFMKYKMQKMSAAGEENPC